MFSNHQAAYFRGLCRPEAGGKPETVSRPAFGSSVGLGNERGTMVSIEVSGEMIGMYTMSAYCGE